MCKEGEKAIDSEVNIRLTVAIPTFNRNEILKANLAKLIPQLNSACELVILDNCSTVPVEDTLRDILATAEDVRIRIIRHRANVGGNENILRCIEYAQGEFVWILGDDDQPADSAAVNIFAELDQHPDALVVNMYATCAGHGKRTGTRILSGSAEYLSASKSLGELIFISSMVLRVDHALPYMSEAHNWQSTCAAQLIVAAMMLRPDGKAVMSSREVVCDIGAAARSDESKKSLITIGLGVPTLLYAPWSTEEARIVRRLVNGGWSARTQLYVLQYLILLANDSRGSRKVALRYFHLLRLGWRISEGIVPFRSVLFLFAWPLIAIPTVGRAINSTAMRVKKPLSNIFMIFGR